MERSAIRDSLVAHDLIRKPVPTFRDHALSRLADKSSLQLSQTRERLFGQRPLLDRRERGFELLDVGKPDLGRGELACRDGKAHRKLGETAGMALAQHGLETPRTRHVCRVAPTRADRLDHRKAERVARLAPRERAAGEHADADRADAMLL